MKVDEQPGGGKPEFRSRVIPRTSEELVPRQCGVLRWLVRQSMAPPGMEQMLEDPDRFLKDPNLLMADSNLITLARVPPQVPGAATLVLRRLNYGRWRHRLRDVFRPTRAERAFQQGLRLEAAGVATPRVVAAGVQRVLRWPVRAYLITECVVGAITLEAYLARFQSLPRALLYRLADLLAQLHEHNFSHRDLKSSNVLFDDQFKPFLIDLDGVRRFDRLSEHRAMLDLARLAWEFLPYPRELWWNARRFLKRYCQRRHLEGSLAALAALAFRELTRQIVKKGCFSGTQRDRHLAQEKVSGV